MLGSSVWIRGVQVDLGFKGAVVEQKWNNLNGFKDSYLKAKARIWP